MRGLVRRLVPVALVGLAALRVAAAQPPAAPAGSVAARPPSGEVQPRAVHGGEGPSARMRLEAAFQAEVGSGDLERAVQGYREITADEHAPPDVIAKAHLRLGICYRILGEARLAKRELETVVEDYPQEVEAVRTAERYLGRGALEDPARFMPPDVLLYVELVDPAEQVAGISALLEGTPLQNPVDTTVSLLYQGGGGRTSGPTSDSVVPAAAFLNEGFLREVQKTEGLALAVPGGGRTDRDFLAVLLPGKSDILRGLVQLLLSLSRAEGIGLVRDVPLLRVPPEGVQPGRASQEGPSPEAVDPPLGEDEWLHVALGPSAVIFGRPRFLVEEAVERSASGGPSLAEELDFRRAQAARAGSFLFSYLGRDRLLSALLAEEPPGRGPALERAADALGWRRLHALGITAAHVMPGDSLRITLRARLGAAADSEGWAALRTAPLDSAVLRAVPTEAIGFLALAFDDDPSRERAAAVIAGRLEEAFGIGSDPGWLGLLAALRSDAVIDTFREVDALAVGVGPEELLPPSLRSFAVLRFRDPDRGAPILERLLSHVLEKVTGNAASRSFGNEDLVLNGRTESVRYVEPWPGVRLRHLAVGDVIVVAFSPGNLARAAARAASRPADPVPGLPAHSRKAIVLRPAEILRTRPGAPGIPPELRTALGAIDRAFIVTREGRDSFSLDIIVPDATPAVRTILERLADLLGAR